MRWIRQNAGWLAAVVTLLGAGATAYLAVYVKAALAEPMARITALETHRTHDAAAIQRIEQKVDEIHRYLLGDKR